MADTTTPTRHLPRYVPLLNPIARRLLRAGVSMGPNALVTIPGRTTGQPRTTPLAIIQHRGRRWVWSPWGEVQWVRNLRAAGRATIAVGSRQEQVRAMELAPEERVSFFQDTLLPVAEQMTFGKRFIRLVDGVDLDHPEREAEGRPVFELRTIDED